MIRLAISVEGQTEEGFVNEVLANHLCPLGVYPFAIRIHRARSTSSGNGGGGNVSFEKLVSDMVNLSWNFNAVTSLVDYYGFKDKGERSVEGLEKDLGREIHRNNLGTKRVFPIFRSTSLRGCCFLTRLHSGQLNMWRSMTSRHFRISAENSRRPKISTTIRKARRASEF